MKKLVLTPVLVAVFAFTARAQLYNDGLMTNSGGLISDWQNQWFNTSNGVFNGSANGVFEHHGPSTQTFVNNGIFNASGGHNDQFLGPLGSTGAQEIGGAVRPYFYNLQLNNGAGQLINITNTDGANVRNVSTFSNGITTTIRGIHQAGALRFEASYTGGDADNQHVNGYVSKIGNTVFTFPVGSGTDIRTLTMSAPSAVTDQYSVAWIVGDPTTTTDPSGSPAQHPVATFDATTLQAVSPVGQWDWIAGTSIPAVTSPSPANSPAGTGTGAGLTISVSIPDMTGFASAADLRLVGWDGTKWINLSTDAKPYAGGTSYASGTAENSTLQGTMVAGITAIGIGRMITAMPVSLVSFMAQAQADHSVLLTWQTAWEKNNTLFIIERSKDLLSFEALGQVNDVAGNSSAVSTYRFTDTAPHRGTSYYRLIQVDRDGTRHTYQAASVIVEGNYGVSPNPIVGSSFTLELDEPTAASVQLHDLSGHPMTLYKTSSGQTSLKLSLESKLPTGIYVLTVVERGNTRRYRLVML